MNELDRNKNMFLLIKKLREDNEYEFIDFIKTLIENDTPSIKRSFLIMTKDLYKENK